MKYRLIEVLIKHAMNWVNCECAFSILCNGVGGLTKRMAILEAEINHLGMIIEESDVKTLITEAKKTRTLKVHALDSLFAKWHSANSIREEHKRLYENCIGLCSKHFGHGYTTYLVLFNAVLLGMDPSHAEPVQALAMPLAAKLIRNIPDKAWTCKRWFTPTRPNMPNLRRVTPEHRRNFITTILHSDAKIVDRLLYDSDSPDLRALVLPLRPPRKRKMSRSKRKSS